MVLEAKRADRRGVVDRVDVVVRKSVALGRRVGIVQMDRILGDAEILRNFD